LAKRIREFLSDAEHVDGRIVRMKTGSPVALMVRQLATQRLEIPILRIVGDLRATIGRHVIHLQRLYALEFGVSAIRVTDPFITHDVDRALNDENFEQVKDEWWAVTIRRLANRKSLAEALDAINCVPKPLGLKKVSSRLRKKALSPALTDELERRFWPMKIKGSDLPTFLVPIRPAFAIELFDRELSEGTIFPQSPLGIFREQVYYRSPQPSGGLRVPARLLWYVKRQPGVAGSGMIRACSYLTEIAIDRPLTLFKRNARLGVYRQADVQAAAKHGNAMALRFELTEAFPHPVSLRLARDLAAQRGCDNLQLQSPWRLPANMFEDVYERGIDGPG
jgi:hypothetical protein